MNEPRQMTASEINDLHSALDYLAQFPGQLVSTKVEVDPYLELAGVYRQVGAGTPVAPPTKIGPAMLFENVKGYGMPVVAGVLASRKRAALLLGTTPERLAFDMLDALNHPVRPVVVPREQAPCQEVVINPPFDLSKVVPAVVSTAKDAGAFINMGLMIHPSHVRAWAGQTERELHARQAHRCVQAEGGSGGQAFAGVGKHRRGPRHLHSHVFRGAHHASWL
jgi:3-polyprenyl-4-hydroxybenzoate decarboxylase